MGADLTTEFQRILAGKIVLPGKVEDLHAAYSNAKPFSHLTIDNMFSDAFLESLLSEMSEMSQDRWSNVDTDTRERTLRMRNAAEMGEAGTRLLSIMHSAPFLYLLSEITGIPQLLPDPYLLGAGYAMMRRNDYFAVHSDRNVAYDTGLLRRLAVIVFLNKEWLPEYHGDLELWSHDAKHCDVRIAPLFNRTAIFEVAFPNYHGVPTPLACPVDRTRRSFILYYHTANMTEQPDFKPHTSIFAPRLHGTNRMTVKSVIRDVTPPLLLRAVRKLRSDQ